MNSDLVDYWTLNFLFALCIAFLFGACDSCRRSQFEDDDTYGGSQFGAGETYGGSQCGADNTFTVSAWASELFKQYFINQTFSMNFQPINDILKDTSLGLSLYGLYLYVYISL